MKLEMRNKFVEQCRTVVKTRELLEIFLLLFSGCDREYKTSFQFEHV